MSRSRKRALLLLAGAAVLAYGIFAIVQAKRQYDYVFLNNTYYAVTHEPARPEELGTQAVGTVRRYAQVAFLRELQEEGDSNYLPVGAVLYESPVSMNFILYTDPENGEWKKAYFVHDRVAEAWYTGP